MATGKILKYVIYDILRSRLIITYTVLLLAISIGIIYLGKDGSKAIASLLNIIILLVPLVSIIFGTIHFYSSRQFMEMMLALPVKRSSIFWAEYTGLASSLSIGFLIGVGIPLLVYGVSVTALYLILGGVLLTFIFTGLAFFASVINNDKAKGIGLSLMLWFFLAILFDALSLAVYILFNNYPLEKAVLIFSALNPIDLARIMVLLRLDISALLGYSGATFQNFFGSAAGTLLSSAMLLVWIAVPALVSLRIFNRKNF